MGRSGMTNFVGIFLIICFMVLCDQAQGRPGKPFHPCGSYFISYSHSEEQTLAVAIPIIKGSEISENPTVFGIIYSYSRVFPITNSNGPKRLPSAHKILHFLPENILSLFIALLFGIGCGVITSVAVYVVWSLITNRYASPDAAFAMGYTPLPASVNASK